MGRSDYHPVLNIYYYIVTGYEPIGFGPLPDRKPIAKILRGAGGRRKLCVLWSKLYYHPCGLFNDDDDDDDAERGGRTSLRGY